MRLVHWTKCLKLISDGASTGLTLFGLHGKQVLVLSIELLPNSVGGFTDAVLFHQFFRHGRQHVHRLHRGSAIPLLRISPSWRERRVISFPLSERHFACIVFVAQELHSDRLALPDSPRSPTRLSQCMQRVSGFVEDDRGSKQEVESGLDQLGVGDENLHVLFQTFPIPRFRVLRCQYWNVLPHTRFPRRVRCVPGVSSRPASAYTQQKPCICDHQPVLMYNTGISAGTRPIPCFLAA